MSKHSKGPWRAGKEVDGYMTITSPEWMAFANVVLRMEDGKISLEGAANAALIAAAPEMYEALCKIADMSRVLRHGGASTEDLENLDEALTEATDLAYGVVSKLNDSLE